MLKGCRVSCSVVVFLVFMLLKLPLPGIGDKASERADKFLLLVIQFDDLLCSSCLESLLDFCLSLPRDFQAERTWGIVVLDTLSGFNLEEKIVDIKVRGFIDSNPVYFPVFVDFFRLFAGKEIQMSQILLFDNSRMRITRYTFPLSRKLKEEILTSILNQE